MIRLFAAIALPESIRRHLSILCAGVPGARWQQYDQFHLTLRFIGEVDGALGNDISGALDGISMPGFDLALSGVGTWGDKRKSHALWAGVRPSEPLMRLRNKIENALVRAGVEPDRRKFHPHVTLARTGASPAHRIGEFIAGHGAFATQSFAVNEFVLFSSFLSHSGAIYTPEASFPLGDHYERQSAWLENAEDMTDAI